MLSTPLALVVGTGPTGLAAALALAVAAVGVRPSGLTPRVAPTRLTRGQTHGSDPTQADPPILLAGPPPVAAPGRTAALFGGSIALLRNLGVWADCEAASAPITGIRLIDDTGGVARAPEALFTAEDAGLDVLGFNVPNTALLAALEASVRRRAGIQWVTTRAVTGLQITPQGITAQLAEGQALHASLVVAADGRGSLCRASAGIGTRDWSYPQSAIVTTFDHGRPHHGISTELHRRAGPLTVVPLPGDASSLVWVEETGTAAALMQLDDNAFRSALETRLQGLLGSIGALAPRANFPLSGLSAERMADRRVALVGEAAHVIPPIGAQGLNLGLRDAATLADCVADALAAGGDPGTPATLTAYATSRRGDVASRTVAVDLLNRSLLADLLPADLLRGLGLHLVNAVAPLRQAVVRLGLQPPGELPRLMRPQGGLTVSGEW